jgi:hypothetical protein
MHAVARNLSSMIVSVYEDRSISPAGATLLDRENEIATSGEVSALAAAFGRRNGQVTDHELNFGDFDAIGQPWLRPTDGIRRIIISDA